MERFTGLLGIVLILGVAFLMSNNRKAINYRTVGVGLLLQVLLAVFILKTVCFEGFPFCPTLVGQYIIKNLVLIAGALIIAGKYNKEFYMKLNEKPIA